MKYQIRYQHTSGDWIVEKGWNSSLPTITAKTSQTNLNERGLIADLTGTPFIEQAEANANLIAASPKLLAALKDMVHADEVISGEIGRKSDRAMIRIAAIDAAIAAIAEATGQE